MCAAGLQVWRQQRSQRERQGNDENALYTLLYTWKYAIYYRSVLTIHTFKSCTAVPVWRSITKQRCYKNRCATVVQGLLYPPPEQPNAAAEELYRKSHRSYGPGEQVPKPLEPFETVCDIDTCFVHFSDSLRCGCVLLHAVSATWFVE
jgi:hypothetical protein